MITEGLVLSHKPLRYVLTTVLSIVSADLSRNGRNFLVEIKYSFSFGYASIYGPCG
jgi:hypothetical protein